MNRRRSSPVSKGASSSIKRGSGVGAQDKAGLIGRRILKPLGTTFLTGYVKEYNPPAGGKQESWTLRLEKNPHEEEDGDDASSGEDEEVDAPELDKRLNLQAVRESSFPTHPSPKRGRGRPRKDSTLQRTPPPRKTYKPPSKKTGSRVDNGAPHASPSSKAVNGSGSGGGAKKRRASAEASSASSSSSAGSSPIPTPITKKGKTKSMSKVNDDKAGELRGNSADIGTRIAKEFAMGMFTGEVVEVKQTGARGLLWKINYEDGDMEDLNEEEMRRYMQTYRLLAERFEAANGQAITKEDLAREDLEDEEWSASGRPQSQGTPQKGNIKGASASASAKGKGKGKGKGRLGAGAHDNLVGVGVRKYFPNYDEEFDGEVSKYVPAESDDEYGDLWLIKYEDGDAEHFDADELEHARALYDKRYALVKKRVSCPTNSSLGGGGDKNSGGKAKTTLFGESPAGPRGVFCTIRGYRRYKDDKSRSS